MSGSSTRISGYVRASLSDLREGGDGRAQALVVAGGRSPLLAIRWGEVTFCGFQVALDGRSGLRTVARHAPDLILLDLRLPDLPGLTVLRRIRRLAPGTPVLVVARRSGLRSVVQAVDLGVAGFLTLPIDVRGLLQRLRRLVRRTAHPQTLPAPPNPRALALGEAALHRLHAPDGARLSVLGLAATLGVSARQLRHATNEAYGIPIKSLILRRRVQLALVRLQESGEPIKAIATDLGFHDAAHLTNTVRRLTGVPPRRHRQHARAGAHQWLDVTRTAEQALRLHAPAPSRRWGREGGSPSSSIATSHASFSPNLRR